MKAIIEVDIPDYQIGQEVSIYFKDTMMIKGVVQEPCEGCDYKEWLKGEVEPMTGEWQQDLDGTFLCSECGSGFKEQPTLMGKPMFLWCPLCGARMVGKEE